MRWRRWGMRWKDRCCEACGLRPMKGPHDDACWWRWKEVGEGYDLMCWVPRGCVGLLPVRPGKGRKE